MTIWVVQGHTGEYSDHTDWLVRAFDTEAAAADWIVMATARAKELESVCMSKYGCSIPEGTNEFDPHMQMDYTGTTYTMEAVELVTAPTKGTE